MSSKRSVAQRVVGVTLSLLLIACNFELDDENEAAGGEIAGVSLAIESPTDASAMDTTDSTVSLAGTASSEAGIYQVSWANDRGGEGVANGTDTWKIDGISLELGDNNVTVTAEDISGETASRNVQINRESGEKGSATLSWNAPTERTDGSPLTNLAGYMIYYGRMSGVYDYQVDIDSPGVLTYVVEDLVAGEWYFSLAAYDAEGLESDRSNEVVREIS